MNREIAHQAAKRLRTQGENVTGMTAMVGLDAFVDEIVRVVAQRTSFDRFAAVEKIAELGTRIVDAAGKSANLELVVERVKLGGNGPIMANALAALGPAVTCVGPLGEPELHPAFAEIAQRAEVVSLGNPAHTDALEFEDGKLMFGKLEPLNDVTWATLKNRLGAEELARRFTASSLVALVNWTMIPAMSDIWKNILEVLAQAEDARTTSKGLYFFDLADPAKHEPGTVAEACRLVARFQHHRRTLLGLNEAEAFLAGSALGYKGDHGTRADVRAVAQYISDALPIETVVVHPRHYALSASQGKITADVDGPFTDNPLISTGAGDHFNAGFCLGKMLGLNDEESLAAGVGTSGYYVRNAHSPSFEQLAAFLETR